MKKLATFLLLIISALGWAQDYKATGKLEKTSADGFYKILLSPTEASYLNENLTNGRVLDSKHAEVPYLLIEENPVYLQQLFKEYEIQFQKKTSGKSTVVRLNNPQQTPINNISLILKNAEVQKTASLTGSDNGEQWFVVRENFILYPANNPNAVSEVRAIEFPLTNYTYYQLEISDSTSAPINILKAGYYDQSVTHGLFTPVADSVSIFKDPQRKQTIIKLTFKEEQIIDKVELRMKGQTFFQRAGTIETESIRKIKKREERYTERLEDFWVRSGQTAVATFAGLKTDNLIITIENGDNPELSIDDLDVYQLNRYLVAWLKKDESYTVGFKGKDSAPPSYDLEYFRDSIPAQVQVLKIQDVHPVEFEEAPGSQSIFTSKIIIWIAIGAVIILLGFMSLRLVRETNNSQKENP